VSDDNGPTALIAARLKTLILSGSLTRPLRDRIRSRVTGYMLIASLAIAAPSLGANRLDGFDVIASPGHPFGTESARKSLQLARGVGATAIAIIPFLWQPSSASPAIVRGSDMTDEEFRQAIRDASALGLATVVKPHVWVAGSWAGAIALNSEDDWRAWFAHYRDAIVHLARIAAEEQADVFCVGTELTGTIARPEWRDVIAAVRAAFQGRLVYFAHDAEEAELAPFWRSLDAVGVTLYPSLGADGARDFRLAAMRSEADRLDALASRVGKPILVGEVGIRSAQGAAAAPWQSAEERVAPADSQLQADVIADWLSVLDRPSVHGVLVWRWFTDPAGGGPTDTDFTVQGKPAEAVLACAWTGRCEPD
jgi:hypothetical protein